MTQNHNTLILAQQDTSSIKHNTLILQDISFSKQDTLNTHKKLIIKNSKIKIKKIPERIITETPKPVRKITHIKKGFNLYKKNINDTISGTQYDTIASPEFDVAQMKYVFPVKKKTNLKQTYFYDVSILKKTEETKKNNKQEVSTNHSKTNINFSQNIIRHSERDVNDKIFPQTDWILIVALLSLAFFSWINLIYKKFISSNILATINFSVASKLFSERNIVTNRISFALNIIYIINASLIGYYIFNYFNLQIINYNGLETFFIFFLILSVISVVKLFLFKFFDFILLSKNKFHEYYYNNFIYNKICSIALFPLIFAIPFTSNYISVILIKISIILPIIVYILKILRGLQISIQIRLSFFYLFLYLCALEIIPLLFIYKIVTTHI
ncbi:MAG: hypothetical protein DRJ01_02615 [Bacteroidetes bacterium]|nr:MAG: hypothetical protein DRJ01_02615 [Bacteroidota bacterium]